MGGNDNSSNILEFRNYVPCVIPIDLLLPVALIEKKERALMRPHLTRS